MAITAMDDLDRAIIRELEQDGRRSMREIARNLDTPEATIRARMKRLGDQGILRIIAFADPHEVGESQLALVQLTVEPASHEAVVAALVAMPETTYVSTVLGESDIVCEVRCADNHELWEILNLRIAALPGVRSTSTRPILKVHKLIYGRTR
ncbi:Lrp/AsnC family transcriptional regulator [Leucobacter sp. HY1910]